MPLSRQIAALPSSQVLSLLLAAAVSAAILMCAILFHQHDLKKQEDYSRQYGQALSNLAARQAVDATLNHDLVSLQVLLSDIADNGRVIGATIHNVENRLLVQGGHNPTKTPVLRELRRSYTTVIALHDSVAGYVTVTLSMQPQNLARQHLLWQFLWGSLSLTLLLCLIALLSDRLKRQATAQQEEEDDEEEYLTEAVPIVQHLQVIDQKVKKPTEIRPKPELGVSLCLIIHNIDTLNRQLNKHSFNGVLDVFEQQIHSVVRLYKPERLPGKADEVELCFKGDNLAEISFNALCCAQLLLSLSMNRSGPTLKLGAQVSPHDDSVNLITRFERQHTSEALPRQVLIHPSLLCEELLNRIEIAQDEHTIDARLVQIAKPYGELIEKQVRQLAEL